MKIEAIKFNDTAEMVVVHPVTGEELTASDGTPMTVVVYGAQSKQFRQAKNAALNVSINKRGKQVTAEQVEANAAKLLADCTIAFNGVDFGDGPILVESARDAYVDHGWFKDQVDDFIGSNANFLAPSKKR